MHADLGPDLSREILEEVRRVRGRCGGGSSVVVRSSRLVLLAPLHVDYITFLSITESLENVVLSVVRGPVTPAKLVLILQESREATILRWKACLSRLPATVGSGTRLFNTLPTTSYLV